MDKKTQSFSQFEKVCKYHLQREKSHKCYCKLTNKRCSSFGCPRRRDKWKDTDAENVEQSIHRTQRNARIVDRQKRPR